MNINKFVIAVATAALVGGMVPLASAEEAPARDKASAAAAKKSKPHSHAEEKTGVPARPATETKPGNKEDAKKDQHLHPRDAK